MSVSLTPKTMAVLLHDGVPVAYLPVTDPDDPKSVADAIDQLHQQADADRPGLTHVELRYRGRLVDMFMVTTAGV